MKWKTRITEMLGIEYPIILGAFAGYDDSELAAAVSEAGGYGILTASFFRNENEFLNAIQKIKHLTHKPFGVNFSIDKPITTNHPFYRYLKICHEEGINTIITAAYKIEEFGKTAKEYGMKWIHKVTVMKHGIKGVELGADAIILTGLEGGGLKNPKQNTFLVNMVNAGRLIPVPYIASGGISTGRGLLTALILGAQAVHLCTAFLATKESPIPLEWKQRIIEADCFDPVIIRKIIHFESDRPKYVPFSMAAGTIHQIISAKDYLQAMIDEAESILKHLGIHGEVLEFTKIGQDDKELRQG
ncbi:MAG: NAD(P)H-dependent flavin oxidoreductase [Candidatus Helarchaeota archaeon]